MTGVTHGTRTAYNKSGCRCDRCNEWNRNRRRAQAARNGGWNPTRPSRKVKPRA